MKKQLSKVFFVLFTSLTLLSSCSSDSSSSSGDESTLMNKWWYDSENFTADVFFNSNGEYLQNLVFGGSSFSNTGTWVWVNQSQKIMKVSYQTGTNAVTEVWFKFSNIQDHSFSIKQSTDGTTYSDARSYTDSDN